MGQTPASRYAKQRIQQRKDALRSRRLQQLQVLVAPELVELAREAAGGLPISDVVRLGLAKVAGVDVSAYTVKPGRPRKPRPDTLPLIESEQIAS